MSTGLPYPLLAEAFATFGRPVVLLDLESTGGNLYSDRVTEIAFLRFSADGISSYEQLINPQQNIPSFVETLTGITNQMVAQQPYFAEIAPQLLPLLQGSILVAHNSKFDYTFLRHEFARVQQHFASPALCTVQLSRKLYPQYYKHSLESIIERHQINVSHRHRAMADVLALAEFLEQTLQQQGSTPLLQHSHKLLNPTLLPHHLPLSLSNSLYRLPDTHGIILWQDQQGEPLHISTHERTYSEIAQLLHNPQLTWHAQAHNIQFQATAGTLHTLAMQAKWHKQYPHLPSAPSEKHFFAIQFQPNEHGELNAQIITLNNGIQTQNSYGLFLHKKAAKQALTEWAKQHQLCPKMLNILPYTLARHEPCPALLNHQCQGLCTHSTGITQQNQLILQHAHELPILGKTQATLIIEERDEISGLSHHAVCKNGLLQMENGQQYFNSKLPELLKQHRKTPQPKQ